MSRRAAHGAPPTAVNAGRGAEHAPAERRAGAPHVAENAAATGAVAHAMQESTFVMVLISGEAWPAVFTGGVVHVIGSMASPADTPEKFGTVRIHSSVLDAALKTIIIAPEVKAIYTSEQRHLCESMGTPAPLLPFIVYRAPQKRRSGLNAGTVSVWQWKVERQATRTRAHLSNPDSNLR